MTGSELLVAQDLDKRYPPLTVALDGVSLTLRRGEIHGLLGVNGAGKSTLIKILAGVEQQDAGTIWVDGRGEVRFNDPTQSLDAGIGVVHQELPLFSSLTAAENVALGLEQAAFLGRVRRTEMRRHYRRLTTSLAGAPDPDARLEDLAIDAWQLVAIARALASTPHIIILDEPTSSLNQTQRASLHDTLRRLRSDGLAILYVSHFLDDVLEVADWVTVLRDGRVSLASPADGLSPARLLTAMVGMESIDAEPAEAPETPRSVGQPVLRLQGLTVAEIGPIDLEVASGELVGLYGLQGCGALELLEAVFGLRGYTGDVLCEGVLLRGSANARSHRGLAFLPPNRSDAAILDWSVAENVNLPRLGLRSFLAIRDRRAERDSAERFASTYGLEGTIDAPVRSLSGGNQQRVALGKWLIGEVRCLLASEPTRGVDVRGRTAIHSILRSLSDDGAGLVMYSTDPEELVAVCTRVIVLEHGAVRDELVGPAVAVANLEAATRIRKGSSSTPGVAR